MVSQQHIALCSQRISDLRNAPKLYCSCTDLFDGIVIAGDEYKLELIELLASYGLFTPLYEQGHSLPYTLDFPRRR
jgi:hypothetical protein